MACILRAGASSDQRTELVDVSTESGKGQVGKGGIDGKLGGVVSLVDQRLARSWSRWPLPVAANGGGWWRTRSVVSSGQVVKRPSLMAAHQLERAEARCVVECNMVEPG